MLLCGLLMTSVIAFAQEEAPKNPNLKKVSKSVTSTKTMIIGPKRLQCIGIMQTGDCYQVKQDKNQKNWESFPYAIKGFKHVEGYEYVISVKVVPSKEALEGAKEDYIYLKTISKKKVK